MFTDTHCHLLSEYNLDISKVIKEAKDKKITRFINSAYNYKSIIEVVDLCSRFDSVFGTIGIHPSEADSYSLKDIELIRNNIHQKGIIGIGEIGLDYHYGINNKEKQIELFIIQLKIAQENNLPVVIHSRDATEDTIRALKQYPVKGVIHSFSGSYETALEYIKMNYLLGINGVVTFKNSKLINTLLRLPLSSIVLETDSPYLTPEPFRGEQNNPSHIMDIAQYIVDHSQWKIDELSANTQNNINRIFDI